MTSPNEPAIANALAKGDLRFVDDDVLAAFIADRRWFAGRHPLVSATILDAVPICRDPTITLCMVEARFAGGIHDVYQLMVGLRPVDGEPHSTVSPADGLELYDVFDDPRDLGELLVRIRGSATITDHDAIVECRAAVGAEAFDPLPHSGRALGADQSNSSVVFDDRMILKCYRRLEPGLHPELEILRFLGTRAFPHVPHLLGWYEHRGGVMDATLGVLQEFRADAIDGWTMVVDSLRAGTADRTIDLLAQLGTTTGALHATLASDHNDPSFAPEEVSPQGLAIMAAALDEFTADLFGSLPENPAIDEIRHRGHDVRELIGSMSKSTGLGRKIRVHGDLHLGQALWCTDRWELIDFEGEPARPINERRRKRSPLRDLAGLLRSVTYASGAARLHHGVDVPAGWTGTARQAVIDAYVNAVEPTGLLPPSRAVMGEVLALYELEKAIYELRYELDHRPDWASIPASSIIELMEGA